MCVGCAKCERSGSVFSCDSSTTISTMVKSRLHIWPYTYTPLLYDIFVDLENIVDCYAWFYLHRLGLDSILSFSLLFDEICDVHVKSA